MKPIGIRISDNEPRNNVRVLKPEILVSILNEIKGKDDYYCGINFLDGMPNKEFANNLLTLIEQVNNSKNSRPITWDELYELPSKFFQIHETEILITKDLEKLKKYQSDNDMLQACNITIVLVDCAFWEVFSVDHALIDRLENKFQDTKRLSIEDIE